MLPHGTDDAPEGEQLAAQAKLAFEAGEMGDARRMLEALIASGLSRPADFYNLGQVCLAEGDLNAAIDALTRVIADIPAAAYARALAFERAGQINRARSDYLEAMRRSPDDADILADLGTLELAAGNVEIALGYLERAAALDPTANWQYADALIELERRADARRALELALSSGELRAHLGLATLDAEDGNIAAAEEHFIQATKTDLTLARSEYAFFLLDIGQPERARQLAQAAADEGDGWSYRPLALALKELGDETNAERYFAAAIEFGDTIEE